MKTSAMIFILSLVPALAGAQDEAPQVAMANTPPLLLTIIVLAAACGCVIFCIQVLSLVRGGQLSRSWMMFTAAFAVLAVSQVVVLLNGFGVIPSTKYIMPTLMIVMSGLFIYGLYDTKRVLG